LSSPEPSGEFEALSERTARDARRSNAIASSGFRSRASPFARNGRVSEVRGYCYMRSSSEPSARAYAS